MLLTHHQRGRAAVFKTLFQRINESRSRFALGKFWQQVLGKRCALGGPLTDKGLRAAQIDGFTRRPDLILYQTEGSANSDL